MRTIFLIVLALGIFTFGCTQNPEDANGVMEEKDTEAMREMEKTGMDPGEPAILAGTTTKYYEFESWHYEQSRSEGKVVFLNFYANWCPVCKAEEPELFAAFDELNNPDVVGYRVNYNDNEVDGYEREMAKMFGITYQHTKVMIGKDGKVALKSLESYTKEKAIDEISRVAG